MLEKGTSGLMSGEGKRAAASRLRTAPFLRFRISSGTWMRSAPAASSGSFRKRNRSAALLQLLDLRAQFHDHSMLVQNHLHQLLAAKYSSSEVH